MRAWSEAGARIRIVSAPTRGRADVVVRYGAFRDQGGQADLGYRVRGATVLVARGLGRIGATTIAAHELGHILGLGHETGRCALMAPVIAAGSASRCGIAACRVLTRCLLRADDRRGLLELYGARAGS